MSSATDLDVVAITDHERIDGALRAAEIHAAGDYSFELVVGEEITTRRGHVLALFVSERIPALRLLDETIEASTTRAASRSPRMPSRRSPRRSAADRSSARAARGSAPPARRDRARRTPSTAGRSRRDARRRLNDEVLRLPAVGNSDAHVLEGIGTAWTWFPGSSAADYRTAIAEATTRPEGTYWSHLHNVDVYRRQLGQASPPRAYSAA